jgi:hypothetical protein
MDIELMEYNSYVKKNLAFLNKEQIIFYSIFYVERIFDLFLISLNSQNKDKKKHILNNQTIDKNEINVFISFLNYCWSAFDKKDYSDPSKLIEMKLVVEKFSFIEGLDDFCYGHFLESIVSITELCDIILDGDENFRDYVCEITDRFISMIQMETEEKESLVIVNKEKLFLQYVLSNSSPNSKDRYLFKYKLDGFDGEGLI